MFKKKKTPLVLAADFLRKKEEIEKLEKAGKAALDALYGAIADGESTAALVAAKEKAAAALEEAKGVLAAIEKQLDAALMTEVREDLLKVAQRKTTHQLEIVKLRKELGRCFGVLVKNAHLLGDDVGFVGNLRAAKRNCFEHLPAEFKEAYAAAVNGTGGFDTERLQREKQETNTLFMAARPGGGNLIPGIVKRRLARVLADAKEQLSAA